MITRVESSIVAEYSNEVASELGSLMPDLSHKLQDSPIPREHLEAIINSPYHDQLIASINGHIVGAATMSLILGASIGNRKAWLEDFVVSSDENIRGTGVGFGLWQEVINWCKAKQAIKLEFTSSINREAAHIFYKRQGAAVRDTDVFSVNFTSD